MTEQEKRQGDIRKKTELFRELGQFIEIAIRPSTSNVTSESRLALKELYFQELQQYVGRSAEVLILEVQDTYAGEDTTDSSRTRLHGTITAIDQHDLQFLADTGEKEYSDSSDKRKLSPGYYTYPYMHKRYSERMWRTETRILKIIVDGENILPDINKPKDKWQDIEPKSRLLLERIEELLGSIRSGKTLVFTYWSDDSDRWEVIQNSNIDENEVEIHNLIPNSRDLAVKKSLPYWHWAVGKTREATRSDEYNWRYECFRLGVTIQPDGSLKAVDFVRRTDGIKPSGFQRLSGSINKEVFVGYLCDSTPESLQDVISRLESKGSE